MTENVNTYVVSEDSDSVLSAVLPASNPLRITWEVLTDDEKKGYLFSALRNLESLNFVGAKINFFQPLKFPRTARGLPVDLTGAPDAVKQAQVYWAAVLANEELYLRRRNTDACINLGLISAPSETTSAGMPEKVKDLLHSWITSWRRI
jgi:hypothetical protein